MRNEIKRTSPSVWPFNAGAEPHPFRNAALGLVLAVLSFVSPSLAHAAVTEAWVQRYHGPARNGDHGRAVAIDKSGNVVVTGTSSNPVNPDVDFYTAKYAGTDGRLLWERRYAGPSNSWDVVNAMVLDDAGNVVVAGVIDVTYVGSIPVSGDYYTAKYAATDGALLWEKRFNGPANAYDHPWAVGVDKAGNVIVTGASGNLVFSYLDTDYYTAKYAAADGALLWGKRYHGPANGSGALAVAADGNGDVVVTGYSDNGTNGYVDFYTIKYAGADGAQLWAKRTDGPAHGNDDAIALVLDPNGNAIVTGRSYSNISGEDFMTVKYAATDGNVLWQRLYNGPMNWFDIVRAVAVDPAGNVVVIGYSSTRNSFSNDFSTVKYAAADGAVLWERSYNHPANWDDRAAAVAVDDRGNVVVAGTSRNSDAGADYYTAKYSGADGALLWEKYYSSPGNAYDGVADLAHTMAVGADGRVAVTGSSDGEPGINVIYDMTTVLYRELSAPVIHCTSNLATHCTGAGVAVVDFTVTATDESAVAPVVTCQPASGSAFPVGQTTVTCTALDEDLLSTTCTFTVTVVDATPPILNCPLNTVAESSGETGTVVAYVVTVTDLCDPTPAVVCLPPSGHMFLIGETPVHCTARDVNSHAAACSFHVTVLGARGIKRNILAELTSLRVAVTDPGDARHLDASIQHLNDSLSPALWIDETHIDTNNGERVFHHESLAASRLCQVIQIPNRQVPDALLQGFIDRIFRADRLLAAVAIQDATAAGASSRDLRQAQEFLSRGDKSVGDDRCSNGIAYYRQAWRHAGNALRP